MKVKLDNGAFAPTRAHDTDAGLDLRSPVSIPIPDGKAVTINTGVHIELPPNTYGKIEAKSGLNIKAGVLALGGVIDEGYSGSIVVKLYNLDSMPYYIKKGDKIAQLLVVPCLYPSVEIVDEITGGERGSDGFGSTGR